MDKYTKPDRSQIPFILFSAIIILGLYYFNYQTIALVLALILAVLVVLVNLLPTFRQNQWDAFVQDSSEKLKENVVQAAKEMSFPLVAFNRDGQIYWYNEAFQKAAALGKMEPMEMEEIIKLDIDAIWKEGEADFITMEERTYEPTVVKYHAAVDEFAEDLIFLHLVDVTEVKAAKDQRIVTMLLEVDNLTEVLNTAPEDRRPFIGAAVEKILVDFATSLNGTIKRYSNNKSILICNFESFRTLMKHKFPILDQVKKVDLGNTIEPTLSIGVSYGNEHLLADSEAAQQAKELALGRGGDQLVIKQGEKLTFFGGNSREVEKKSRVRSRVIAHALRDLILESSHVYIMGHANPDMDCLGAAVGINAICRYLEVPSSIVMDENHSNVEDLMAMIAKEESYGADSYISSADCLERLTAQDLVIIVDVHSEGYVLNKEIAMSEVRRVVIDHHRRTQDAVTGITLSYIETYASSTSELVAEVISYIMDKPKLLKVEADALLAGIMVDTKNFFIKTGSRTFEAASFLRKLGADTVDIRELLSYDRNLYLLKAAIIQNGEVKNGVAVAVAGSGIQDPLIAAQAADEFLNLRGVHTSFVLMQVGPDVIMSARSNGDDNVQVIMEKFGGGGHMTMSGAKVTDGDVMEVKEELMKYIQNLQEEEDNESDTLTGR